jgi:hypothetical protein
MTQITHIPRTSFITLGLFDIEIVVMAGSWEAQDERMIYESLASSALRFVCLRHVWMTQTRQLLFLMF